MERISRLPHVLRQIICLFGYSFYFSFVLIFASLMIPLSIIALPFGKSSTLFHIGMNRSLSLLVNQFLPFIRVCRITSFEYRELLETNEPVIVIGNHRSWLDGPVIISNCQGITPIMKEGYAKNPFYQIFTRWFDFISVNAQSPESIRAAKDSCLKILNQKGKLLIFPEGSRSSTNKLLPFRKLAFQLSIENRIPIIAVLQSGDTPFMTKGERGSYFPKREVHLRVRVLKPILPEENESVNQFTHRVERLIAQELKTFDMEKM